MACTPQIKQRRKDIGKNNKKHKCVEHYYFKILKKSNNANNDISNNLNITI